MQFIDVSYGPHWRNLGIVLGVAGFNVRHGFLFFFFGCSVKVDTRVAGDRS